MKKPFKSFSLLALQLLICMLIGVYALQDVRASYAFRNIVDTNFGSEIVTINFLQPTPQHQLRTIFFTKITGVPNSAKLRVYDIDLMTLVPSSVVATNYDNFGSDAHFSGENIINIRVLSIMDTIFAFSSNKLSIFKIDGTGYDRTVNTATPIKEICLIDGSNNQMLIWREGNTVSEFVFEYYGLQVDQWHPNPVLLASNVMTTSVGGYGESSCYFENTQSVYVINVGLSQIERLQYTYNYPVLGYSNAFTIGYDPVTFLPSRIVNPRFSYYLVIMSEVHNQIMVVLTTVVANKEILTFPVNQQVKRLRGMSISSHAMSQFQRTIITPPSVEFILKRLLLRNDSDRPTSSWVNENIVNQGGSEPLFASSQKLGLSQSDQVLLVANTNKIGIFDQNCPKEYALDKNQGMCIVCFDKPAPLPEVCTTDPRAVFLTWTIFPALFMTTQSSFSFQLEIQLGSWSLDLLKVQQLVEQFKNAASAITNPGNINVTFSLKWASSVQQIGTVVHTNLVFTATTPTTPGQIINFSFGQVQQSTSGQQFGNISLVKNPTTISTAGCNPLTEVMTYSSMTNTAVCFNCLLKSSYPSNQMPCSYQSNIQFYDWSVSANIDKFTDINQNRYYGKMLIPSYDWNIFPIFPIAQLQLNFRITLLADPTNSINITSLTSESYPGSTYGAIVKFEIQLTRILAANDEIEFEQLGTNLLNQNNPVKVLNLLDYGPQRQKFELKKCNYYKQNLYNNNGVFGCKDCEFQTDFLDNQSTCQSGSILRFFDWELEEIPEPGAQNDSGEFFCYFKIIGFNIPMISMLDQMQAFLETSLIAEFDDGLLNINLSIIYDNLMVGQAPVDFNASPENIKYRIKLTPNYPLAARAQISTKINFRIKTDVEKANANNVFDSNDNFLNLVRKTTLPFVMVLPRVLNLDWVIDSSPTAGYSLDTFSFDLFIDSKGISFDSILIEEMVQKFTLGTGIDLGTITSNSLSTPTITANQIKFTLTYNTSPFTAGTVIAFTFGRDNYQSGSLLTIPIQNLELLVQTCNPKYMMLLSNSNCVRCAEILEYEAHKDDCKSNPNVKFYEWQVSLDLANIDKVAKKLIFAKITILDFEWTNPESLSLLSVLQNQFRATLDIEQSNLINLIFRDPIFDLSNKTATVQFEIQLQNPLTADTDKIYFEQSNTNILYDLASSPIQVVNLVDYNQQKQYVVVKQCNFFSQALWTDLNQQEFECQNCLEEIDFDQGKIGCQTGYISRFFKWTIENNPTPSDKENLSFSFYFTILEFNLIDDQMLVNIAAFLQNSLRVESKDKNLTPSLSVSYTPPMVDTIDPKDLPTDLRFNIKLTAAEKIQSPDDRDLQLQFSIDDNSTSQNAFQSEEHYLNFVRLKVDKAVELKKFLIPEEPNPNITPKSPEEQSLTEQKPANSTLSSTVESTTSKATLYAAAGGAAASGVASVCSVGLMNLGTALIKMFQIIEILGKLLYLPIYFQGLLLNVLYSVEQLSSLVSLPSSLIFPTEGAQKSRYWTKFTIYENEENVFQSEVIASLALSVSSIHLTSLDLPYSISDPQGSHIYIQDLGKTQEGQQNGAASLLSDSRDDCRRHHLCSLLQLDHRLQKRDHRLQNSWKNLFLHLSGDDLRSLLEYAGTIYLQTSAARRS